VEYYILLKSYIWTCFDIIPLASRDFPGQIPQMIILLYIPGLNVFFLFHIRYSFSGFRDDLTFRSARIHIEDYSLSHHQANPHIPRVYATSISDIGGILHAEIVSPYHQHAKPFN